MNSSEFRLLCNSLGLTAKFVTDYLGLKQKNGIRNVQRWWTINGSNARTPPDGVVKEIREIDEKVLKLTRKAIDLMQTNSEQGKESAITRLIYPDDETFSQYDFECYNELFNYKIHEVLVNRIWDLARLLKIELHIVSFDAVKYEIWLKSEKLKRTNESRDAWAIVAHMSLKAKREILVADADDSPL